MREAREGEEKNGDWEGREGCILTWANLVAHCHNFQFTCGQRKPQAMAMAMVLPMEPGSIVSLLLRPYGCRLRYIGHNKLSAMGECVVCVCVCVLSIGIHSLDYSLATALLPLDTLHSLRVTLARIAVALACYCWSIGAAAVAVVAVAVAAT